MKKKRKIIAVLLALMMVLTYMPALTFADSEDAAKAETDDQEVFIDVGSTVQVTVSPDEYGVLYFIPKKSGGYLLSETSQEHPNTRVFLYEEEEVSEEDDSDGWKRLDYTDFDEEDTFAYAFYAEAEHKYKLEVECSFLEEEFTHNLSLSESDRAGIYEGFHYSAFDYHEETFCRITNYSGNKSDLVIPGEINGYTVKIIEDWAISGDFTSVTVNEGVTEIGNYGIIGYENLKKVYLPSTLRYIFGSPFANAGEGQEIIFPNGSDNFHVADDMLISDADKTLSFAFGPKKDTLTVPEGIKYIEGESLDSVSPKILYLPKSVKDVFQMPSSLEEMHIGNANCEVSYYGIPWTDYDSENDTYIYSVKVYAPEGGSLQQYCIENGITFIAEGDPYDPSQKLPMSDPVELSGKATLSFLTDDGAYQDFVIKPDHDDLYSINVDFSDNSMDGDIERSEVLEYQMTDEAGNIITALVDEPLAEEYSPGYIFYLKGGQTYTLRLSASEKAIACKYNSEWMEICIKGSEPVDVNGYGWDGCLAAYDVEEFSYVLSFTTGNKGEYTINRRNSADYDDGDLTMMLFSRDKAGNIELIHESRETFTVELDAYTDHYLALIERGGGDASVDIKILGQEPCSHPSTFMEQAERIEPTCTAEGSRTLVTKCSTCGEELKRETQKIPALGHAWKAPEYSWADDNSSVTATRVCSRDGSHVETETATAEGKVVKAATAVEDGLMEYTAVFSNAAFEKQTKTAVIPKRSIEEAIAEAEEAAADAAQAAEKASEDAESSTDPAEAEAAAADAQAAVNQAAAAEAAAQAVIDSADSSDEQKEAAEAALQSAKEIKATASAALATAKSAGAKVAANKAYAAKSAAAGAVKGSADAVNKAKAAETAAGEAVNKAEAACEAAKEAFEAVKQAGYEADSDEYKAAEKAVTDTAAAKTAAETALTEASKAVTAAEKAKSDADAAARAEAARQAEIKANNGVLDKNLPKVKIQKPKAAKKSMTAKWKKLSKKQLKVVKGIEVEYSLTRDFSNPQFKTAGKKKADVKIKKLKSKKTYYVRAHTYVVRNGVKYVSPWSKVKKIKIK